MDIVFHIKKFIQDFRYRRLKMGHNSRVGLGVRINFPERMSVGNNSYINGGDFIIGESSSITIGNDCLISYNVHFRTVTHCYEDKKLLIRQQGHKESDIVVEDDVWVGFGAQIMPGTTLHKGCVVGAGSVVTHDVPSYAVVGGVPSHIIKFRE